MPVIAVTSVRGSPGATTLAIELTRRWPSSGAAPLLIEADPDGGCIAAREGLAISPGLTDLAAATRSTFSLDELARIAQPLTPRGSVIVAHPSAEQVHRALRAGAVTIGSGLAAAPGHVAIVDAGRLRPGSPVLPLIHSADTVLLVVNPSLDAIANVVHGLPLLTNLPLALVLTARMPYAAADVAAATGIDPIASLPRATSRRSGRALAAAIDALASRLADALLPNEMAKEQAPEAMT